MVLSEPWKLFHKDEIVSEDSSWIFRFAPYVIFVAPIFVALLIPILTRYPLFFAFMGDMLGGGFVLALGGFFATLAAVDTANPSGPVGASRTRRVGFLAEPMFMIVFFWVGRGLLIVRAARTIRWSTTPDISPSAGALSFQRDIILGVDFQFAG
jgi:formate hydrogenlyase subunit 4